MAKSRILRNGDHGTDVRAVQDVLNFHIRRLQPLIVDGRFGAQTQARVTAFQSANSLLADGIVGPRTTARLFETQQLPLALRLSPRSTPAAAFASASLRPPRLIPRLSLPGSPPSTPTLPVLSPVQLFPSGSARLPPLTAQGQTLAFVLNAPLRNDPQDPTARSQQQALQLLQTLPANFPFRATIIGVVPQPAKTPGDPERGFKWGIDPVFDRLKLAAPVEFAVGLKGRASFTVQVVSNGTSGLKLGIFVGADFKALLDYTSAQATARPLFELQGSVTTGLGGVF